MNPGFFGFPQNNPFVASSQLTGTSGGVPYYPSSTAVVRSSGLLDSHLIVLGGGAGAAPHTVSAPSSVGVILQGSAVDPNWTATPILGAAPGTPGSLTFQNNSSGSMLIQPITGVALAGTLTLPNVTGTVVTTGDTGTVTNAMISGTLTNHSVVVAGATGLASVAPGTSGNVLTSNGTDWVSSAPAGGSTLTINAQTASYTLVLGDAGKLITMSVAGANNLTIPTNASVAFPIGTTLTVQQIGAGTTTIVAATPGTTTINSTGATPASPTCRVQWSGCTLVKTATDVWTVMGDIA